MEETLKNRLCEFKAAFMPYSTLWVQYSSFEECFLNRHEINSINSYIKSDFSILKGDSIVNQFIEINELTTKLILFFPFFQNWLGFKFVLSLVKMSRKYGQHSFLHTPIDELDIEEDLKVCLKKFGIQRIWDIIEHYKDGYFERPEIYNNILEFKAVTEKQNSAKLFEKWSEQLLNLIKYPFAENYVVAKNVRQ